MYSHPRTVFGTLGVISILMILILGIHVGGQPLLNIGVYSPLSGAFIGAMLVFVSVSKPLQQKVQVEPWLKREKLAWILMGCGCLAWGIGECFWRSYLALGQTPFPSLADFGYASFPPLVFVGLLLQPSSQSGQRRIFFLLDSLIAMGALLSIAWFLLLGVIALTPAETVFAKVLLLYYPTMDTALLSCAFFLLLRGSDQVYQAPARRFALFAVVIGLFFFATSDFLFNLQNNLGIYRDGTWVDLGWPLGLMTIGVGAYFRCFTFALPGETLERGLKQQARLARFEPAQLLPYLLLALLFYALVFNVLSTDQTQQGIRFVLVILTVIVVGLVLVRQILTMFDNTTLLRKQSATMQKLEKLNQDISDRNTSLETGIMHLKEIQTRLANGEVQARSSIMSGELWPLGVGLNLMADRMMRIEQNQAQAQKLARAIDDLSQALARSRGGSQFIPPASSLDFPEIQRLILALGLKPAFTTHQASPAQPGKNAVTRPIRRWKGLTRVDRDETKST